VCCMLCVCNVCMCICVHVYMCVCAHAGPSTKAIPWRTESILESMRERTEFRLAEQEDEVGICQWNNFCHHILFITNNVS